MSVSQLSASSQNYLKVIWGLQEWSDAPVTTSALAAKLAVQLSTVSDALSRLAAQGLIEREPYGPVALTESGRSYAIQMVRRHRLIETFLVQLLGYRWDQVHDEAESLEHAASDFLVDRIDERLGFPRRDPHGDPIPGPDGDVSIPDATLLSEVDGGSRVVVERISDDDPHLLQFFTDRGLEIGTIINVEAGSPYSDALQITADGAATVTLGSSATDAVWVSHTC